MWVRLSQIDTHTPVCVRECEKGLMKGDISHLQSVAKNFSGAQLCNRVTELTPRYRLGTAPGMYAPLVRAGGV